MWDCGWRMDQNDYSRRKGRQVSGKYEGPYRNLGMNRRVDCDVEIMCTGTPMNHPQSPTPNPPSRRPRRRDAGFTLIEAALTTVIVGTGVLSIVAAQQAYHQKNDWAQRTGTAMLLANELRELTMPLPVFDPITGKTFIGPEPGEATVADYDDLDDFAGVPMAGIYPGMTFDPPIDALRRTIADMPGWSQHVTVDSVLVDNIAASFVQPLGTTPMLRLTVDVLYQGPNDPNAQVITQLTWVVGQ